MFGTPAVYADSHSFVLPRRPEPDEAHRRRTHQAVAAILKTGQTGDRAGFFSTSEMEVSNRGDSHPHDWRGVDLSD